MGGRESRDGELWAAEMRVMARPAAGFAALLAEPTSEGWRAWRRPLFVASVMGCMVSLAATRRLILWQVAAGLINGGLVLLGQAVALAAVRRGARKVPFARVVDLFFAGFGPWLLWMVVISAVWAFAPWHTAFVWGGRLPIVLTGGVVALWSGYIDYCFFRQVLARTRGRAAWDLVQQRAIAWSLTILIFGAGPLGAEVTKMVNR